MDLLEYLKQEPRARLRSNKNRAIGNLAMQKYIALFTTPGDIGSPDKAMMADMVGEILSMDRKWRKILEENPDLRGTDYQDKEILEVEKQRELGYNI